MPDFEPVREHIERSLVEQALPSLAVGVARAGEVLWSGAFGWADRERRIRADEHTLYSLASISKPITATGLMILVERGLINLDRPANDYLGTARLVARVGDAREATVRRIANHTSGLPLHYQFFPEDEPYLRPPMAETIRRYGNLVTAPGETFQYSNLGYGVLDHVIARVSNRSYREFMRSEVFRPLGLTRISVDIGPGLEPFAARRYHSDGSPVPFYDFSHPGGSAVFASAHDLLRFGMFHLKSHRPEQKAIVSDATIDAMQAPTARAPRTLRATIGDGGYGVGFSIVDELGYRRVGHSGGMHGVSTQLTLIPSEQVAIVALANANSDLPRTVTQKILGILLPETAAERERLLSQPSPAEEAATFAPEPELLGTWQGNVHTDEGDRSLSFTFKESGDVHARLGNQLTTLLTDARIENGVLSGTFAGDLGTADVSRRPYHLYPNLRLRGDVLNGSLTAISLPGTRPPNALSHWCELKRQAGPTT